jgi:DNA-binding beta-propeller fold protein YncE
MGGKNYQGLILVLCCLFASCVKDKPASINHATPGATGNVYIVCEGNFGNGDATLYAYEPLHDSVFGDLYQAVNHQPLGDVFQSMTRIRDQFFLCVNNSDKVVALNANDRTLAGTINIPKPRYILTISTTKAYVSTEYSNKVYIINPQTMQVTGAIDIPYQNPEGMCLVNNNAVIATWDTASNSVCSIDITTDKITQAYKTAGYAPQEVLVDKEQMLWVLAGNPTDGKTCTWTRIDPSTGEMLASYTFPADANTVRPVFNITKDTLYFIEANQDGGTANNGIYRMDIHSLALPTQPFVAAKQYEYFWALGIDPSSGNIYIGDPKGFIQKGTVYIYHPDGTLVNSFNVGLGPGHFYFDE